MNDTDKRRMLTANDWSRGMPARLIEELLAIAVTRRLADGEALFAQGDPPEGLYCVTGGRIRMSAIAADGREILIGMFEPGTWFGEVSLVDNARPITR